MSESPLLAEVGTPRSRIVRQLAGFGCLAIGFAAVATTTAVHFGRGGGFSELPDLRITLPFAIAAVVGAGASMVRHERAWWQCVVGVALALSCLALGWVTALATIVGVVVAVIVLLSQLM